VNRTVSIGWCGTGPPAAFGTGGRWQVRALLPGHFHDAGPDLIVLESAAFPTLDACRQARLNLPGPALLIVGAEELPDVLDWLPESDDVCLSGSPPELIAYRLERLVRSRAMARDPLTGMLTRTEFDRALEQFARQASPARPVSLILADLDHFKEINDRHGHAAGDRVLQSCGTLLRECCGPDRTVARIGGEEFAALSRDDEHISAELAERIRARAEALTGDAIPRVTLSLGIATAREPLEPDALFRQADEALYAGKARGRNVAISYAELESASLEHGDDIAVTGLANRARVLSERVANYIALRSKRLLENLRAEAETDGLTRFYTRRSLDRRLQIEFDAACRRASRLSVALVDLDHFGQINKTHGWPTGDRVLRDVCDLIRHSVRGTDWVGRYGGEELCIVMPDTSPDAACAVLERLRLSVEAAPFTSTSGEPVPVTLSIGIAACAEHDTGPAAVIERASLQTLAAKRAGRNRVCAESAPVA
jgi:two-component system, cell cycle response regulator